MSLGEPGAAQGTPHVGLGTEMAEWRNDGAAVLAPLIPRSASTTRTAERGQPSCTARSVSAYCRSVDSRLRSSWEALDWRV
jgi:hypothetical protein